METGNQEFDKSFVGESFQDAGDALQGMDIAYLALGKRVEQTLQRNGIRTLADLLAARDTGYMFVHGIGPKAARSIETVLSTLVWARLSDKVAEDTKLERNHNRFGPLLSKITVSSLHEAWTDANIERLKDLLNSPIEVIHLSISDTEALVAAGCRSVKHALRLLRRGSFHGKPAFVRRVKNSVMWHLEVGIGGLPAAEARVPLTLRSSLCQSLSSLADLVPALREAFSQSKRESHVWQRRMGLGEQGYPTLAQLSEELKLSRERVRQIEMGLSTRIADFIRSPFKGLVQDALLPPQTIALLENVRASISARPPQPISLRQASETLKIDVPDPKDRQHLVRFLLESFGLVKVGTVRGISIPIEVWSADAKADVELVQQALRQTKEYLRVRGWPEESDAIAHALEKNGIPRHYTKFALDASPEVVDVESGQYELKFGALPTLADKAYRILTRADVVMHVANITSAIKSASIDDKDHVSPRYAASRMAVDDRFRRGGRSGEWGLAAWPIERETIPQLAHRLFTEKGPVIPIAEAEELLRTWRPDVTPQYISNYLHRADLFYIDDAGVVRQIEPSRTGRRNVQKLRSEQIQAEFIRAVGKHTQDAVENDDRSFTLRLHNPFAPSIRVYLFELGALVLNGNVRVYRHQVTQGSSGRKEQCCFLSQDGAFPLLVGYVKEYSAFVFWDALLHDGKRYAYTVTVNERTVVLSLSGHVVEQQRSLKEGLEETVLAAHRSRVGEAIRRRWELTLDRLTA
ncbi:hypothetical protein KAU37_04065 [Candidatus Bipolaricaulota bacterium]|nr:hypothetical protein [Candidatus Bipolaricaulota bacterium]